MPTISTLRSDHPRLLFTPEAESALRARLATDPLLAQLVASVRTRSDTIAGLPPVPFTSVPQEEFGIQILEVSRAILERVTAHGLLYRLTGEPVYADRLWREVETALSYPTWNPAIMLDAAEMLLAVAFAYDWAYDVWTPARRATIRQAMIERVITRGLEIYETRTGLSSFFPTTPSNWNSVSNAGLLAGVLAMAEDEPALASRVLAHALESLPHAQRSYEPDGASEEGATYWGYGTDFFCLAAGMLESALGDGAGLLDSSGIARTALYRLHVQSPCGLNFRYADCWPRTGPSLAYALLAARFGPAPAGRHLRALLPDMLAELGKDSGNRLAPLITLWLAPAEASTADQSAPLDAFFSGRVHLAMLRSAWDDPRAAYLGFKAGHAVHGHSHLDLGSFVFDNVGVRWAADLGPDNYYLPGYFRSEHNLNYQLTAENSHLPHRWSYLRNNNHGHCTLTLGGDLQSRDAFAPFIATGSTPDRAFAIADLSAVYPGRASAWRRSVSLNDRTWVAVRDELEGLQPGVSVEWALITEATVIIADDARSATLRRDGETLHVRIAEAPASARLSAAPARPPTAAENQNEGVTRLVLTWSADTPAAVLELHLIPSRHAPTPGAH